MTNIPLDTLKHIISFLDWTCNFRTFNHTMRILKLTDNEIAQILEYWKKHTRFEITTHTYVKRYLVNGKIHREDGPASEWLNTYEWWLADQLHRIGGPAVHDAWGYNEWWVYGKKHRLDGPAVELNKYKEWWARGKLHRVDGPAIEHPDTKEWWQNGLRHRLDGPAVERLDGGKEWWLYGKHETARNVKQFQMKINKKKNKK